MNWVSFDRLGVLPSVTHKSYALALRRARKYGDRMAIKEAS